MVAKSTPSVLKLKKCRAPVRDPQANKSRRPCGKEYLGSTCPNKSYHLLSMKTGFCSNGWCEGSKAKDWRGNPAPTCAFILECPCSCHDDLDKLFLLTEKERMVVESSGYSVPERTFWLPSDDPEPPLSPTNGTDTPTIVESPAPDRVPATIVHDFNPTETGRAARGELESWVKQHCDIWLIDEPGDLCTPQYLANEIARDLGIAPPSVGAIGAVFDRWVRLGFAVCLKKPVRFERYTDEGIKLGLEVMKAQAKKQSKIQKAQHRNNLRSAG